MVYFTTLASFHWVVQHHGILKNAGNTVLISIFVRTILFLTAKNYLSNKGSFRKQGSTWPSFLYFLRFATWIFAKWQKRVPCEETIVTAQQILIDLNDAIPLISGASGSSCIFVSMRDCMPKILIIIILLYLNWPI